MVIDLTLQQYEKVKEINRRYKREIKCGKEEQKVVKELIDLGIYEKIKVGGGCIRNVKEREGMVVRCTDKNVGRFRLGERK